ncbi:MULTISPECIES: helix-turn-helix domain-containing protein [Erwiniaceae]|uniref:helix-turn-helix domain-containing protein n=1 Tax=Erwiniaceae TaxID=1903409 RepID=UPI00190959BE|nr:MULTISPECIES: helix-turn-helix domain-containing protein [Erwiniaceae]MBK0092649.1 AraC family transcriptional regulator [Erwinia sp. S59]MBK0122275.1 AraC family transcriptional regulator [Pantoea sp. S61]MBK0123016.1 AraC family transcriptional regulator [Pantoea sp. S61]
MTQFPLYRHSGFQPEQPWFVLNAARHYSVIASDNPAISHFYSFEVAQNACMTLAIPDGCVDIVFDCDAQRPAARVCGTTLEARGADMQHNHHYFGVRFAPGIIPDFLDVMAEEIPDREFNFLDVVPDARLAFEQIVQTRDFSRQIALFNAFFTPRLVRKASAVTSLIIQTMRQQKGNIRIDQLEALTGYTCRTIQRQFRQDTGMSPKAFSRILRCQSALGSIHLQQEVSFSDLAFDLGFSDQSHFLREFKKFISTTPCDYQRRISHDAYFHRLRFH